MAKRKKRSGKPAVSRSAKPSPRKRGRWLLPLGIAAAVIVVVLLVGRTGGGETPKPTDGTQPTQQAVSLPVTLACGLRLENILQYSGMNPDLENREGADIAAIEISNPTSGYLLGAELTVTLTDGRELRFRVEDLPAGKRTTAFSLENATVGSDVGCVDARGEAEFAQIPVIPPQVRVEVDGIAVTVTNVTDAPLTDIDVYCRSPLDETYFGGVAYSYKIENLPARASVTVDAAECIFGIAEVVRIGINQE